MAEAARGVTTHPGPLVHVLVVFCFIPAVAFPVYYATLRWWDTLPGRAVMVLSVSLALALTVIFLSVVINITPPDWTRVLIYGAIGIGLWTQLGVLIYVSRRSYTPEPEDEPVPKE